MASMIGHNSLSPPLTKYKHASSASNRIPGAHPCLELKIAKPGDDSANKDARNFFLEPTSTRGGTIRNNRIQFIVVLNVGGEDVSKLRPLTLQG